MSLRFDRYGNDDDGPRRPPPNYFSRRTQYRMLTLVGMLMLLLVVMDKARDPEIYRQFFKAVGAPLKEESQPGMNAAPGDEGTPDGDRAATDAAKPSDPANSSNEADATIGFTATADSLSPIYVNTALAGHETEPSQDPLVRTRRDAWREVMDKLATSDRELFQATLDTLLYAQRLNDRQREAWPELLTKLDVAWTEYVSAARAALDAPDSTLSDAERQQWRGVLGDVMSYWIDETRPLLEEAFPESAETADLTVGQQQRLIALRHELLDIAIGEIRDNMMLRPPEALAWFGLLNSARLADEAQLRRRSDGAVSYLEMYKQPEAYRGRLINVRGEARLAYHVRAPKNPYGIDGYYVFTIKPADGTRSPLIVYTVELPPGFPAVKDRDVDRGTTELNEDVEFTGYLFKRWVYRSRGGIDTAPLLLAKAPEWHPAPPMLRQRELPSITFVAAIVGVTLLAAILIAVWAFRQSENSPRPRST